MPFDFFFIAFKVVLKKSFPFFSILIGPQFAGNPDAVARNAAVLDGLSYAAFVAVSVGGVNVTVTCFEGGKYTVVGGLSGGTS